MKLREARERLEPQLSQEEVSRLVECSVRHYNQIEMGKSLPNIVLALSICELLEINPYDVDEWKEEMEKWRSRLRFKRI